MGYIKDMYGSRSKDFLSGFLAAMDTYAIDRNGVREIGLPGIPLKDAVKEAIKELGWGVNDE